MTDSKEKDKQDRTGWIPVGMMIVSILTSLAQVLDSILKSAKSLDELIGFLPVAILILWVVTIVSAVVVKNSQQPSVGRIVFEKNSQTQEQEVSNYRYDEKTRKIAEIVLVLSWIFPFLILGTVVANVELNRRAEESEIQKQTVPPGKFGIVVADFAEGINFAESSTGKEIAQLFVTNLERDLQGTGFGSDVAVRRWKTIRNQDSAREIGATLHADLVIWGWIPQGTKDALVPTFSLIAPNPAPTPTPQFIGSEITGLETVQLGQTLSGRTAVFAAIIKGFALLRQGDPNQAVGRFSDAIIIASNDEKLISDEASRQKFRQGLESILYLFRALAYDKIDNVTAAQSDLKITRDLDPNSSMPYLSLGNMYYSRSLWSQAEEQYLLALKVSPDDASGHYSLGNAYLSQQKVKEAVAEYEKAIVLKPKFVLAYFNLGLGREFLNDCTNAKLAFAKVLELAPTEPIATQAEKRSTNCGLPTVTPTVATTGTPPVPQTPTPLPTVDPWTGLGNFVREIPATVTATGFNLLSSIVAVILIVSITGYGIPYISRRRSPLLRGYISIEDESGTKLWRANLSQMGVNYVKFKSPQISPLTQINEMVVTRRAVRSYISEVQVSMKSDEGLWVMKDQFIEDGQRIPLPHRMWLVYENPYHREEM